jgi:hypothetical protein
MICAFLAMAQEPSEDKVSVMFFKKFTVVYPAQLMIAYYALSVPHVMYVR